VILVYAIPSALAAGTAAALGWGFSNWQYWMCVLPVAVVSAAFYVAHGY
jgi:hypothetical protein